MFARQSFSAVVGPNGSGKSNVIDAMLFVFGKRAKQVSILKFILKFVTFISSTGIISAIIRCIFLLDLFTTQMRLNKVSELIHNSTNHQNLESAGVSVHFQEIIDTVLEHINSIYIQKISF